MKKIIFSFIAVFLISFSSFVYALANPAPLVCPLQYHVGCQIKGIETAQMTSPLDGTEEVTLLELFQALSKKITDKVNEAYGEIAGVTATSEDISEVMDELTQAEIKLTALENQARDCAD